MVDDDVQVVDFGISTSTFSTFYCCCAAHWRRPKCQENSNALPPLLPYPSLTLLFLPLRYNAKDVYRSSPYPAAQEVAETIEVDQTTK